MHYNAYQRLMLVGIFFYYMGGSKMNKERRILRKPEIMTRIGLSDATIWRLERRGAFPRRIRLGGNSVGWFSDEVDRWLEQKAAER